MSTMTIHDVREVDLTDTAALLRSYGVARAAELFRRPDAPFWSEREYLVEFQQQDESELLSLYAAYDGDEIVGCGFLALPQLDNRDKAFSCVWTAPDHERQGIGSPGDIGSGAAGRQGRVGLGICRWPTQFALERHGLK